MLTKVWSDILGLAQRAPSPHNVQPWKVAVTSDTTCLVYIETARTLPKEDTTGSFIISGMVMYLETMRYAAQNYGHDLRYVVQLDQPAANGLQLFAEVTITPDNTVVPAFTAETIVRRRTSRLGYSAKPIPAAHHERLQAIAKQYGYTYGDTANKTTIEQLLKLNVQALFHDLNSANYHDEIVSWFRFTRRSSLRHRDGLDARCMNVPSVEYKASAVFPWLFRLPVVRTMFAKRYRSILGSTTCMAWVSGDFWRPNDAVNAGKFLIHFWLELTRLGLYLHPFGNLVTNTHARGTFEDITKTKDVWFVVRLGYTKQPPESYRHPVADILIERQN